MNFDLRLPIGIMFSLFGLILTIYGAATRHNDMYSEHSLGININLIWGAIMLVFGLFMFLLTWNASRKTPKTPEPQQQNKTEGIGIVS